MITNQTLPMLVAACGALTRLPDSGDERRFYCTQNDTGGLNLDFYNIDEEYGLDGRLIERLTINCDAASKGLFARSFYSRDAYAREQAPPRICTPADETPEAWISAITTWAETVYQARIALRVSNVLRFQAMKLAS